MTCGTNYSPPLAPPRRRTGGAPHFPRRDSAAPGLRDHPESIHGRRADRRGRGPRNDRRRGCRTRDDPLNPKALVGILCLALARPLQAQSHDIRWWEAAAAVGTIGSYPCSIATSTIGSRISVRRTAIDSPKSSVAAASPRYSSRSAAHVAAGVVTGRPNLRRRRRAGPSLAGPGWSHTAGDEARRRPSASYAVTDPYVFKPFSQNDAFPVWPRDDGVSPLAASLSRRSTIVG